MLEQGQVHIWKVHLDQKAGDTDNLIARLAEDEQERAFRFHNALHRSRYVVSRYALREILGSFLKVLPETLVFSYTVQGKPYLADSADGLNFNMARSGGLAIYAVAIGPHVGIDLEQLRLIPDRSLVAQNFLTPREMEALESLPQDVQDRAFLSCWTRKEAFLKALGVGLSEYALRIFDVSSQPCESACLLDTRRGDSGESHRWTFIGVDPGPGYVAALCLQTPSTHC